MLPEETFEGLPPAIFEALKKSAEQTQTRQLKRLQQLKKQAEASRQRELRWHREEERKAERAVLRQQELEKEALERAHKKRVLESILTKLAEARRLRIQEERENQRLQTLASFQEKCEEGERRDARLAGEKKRMKLKERSMSNLRQLKREEVKTQSDWNLENKRNEMLEKQLEAENKMSKRNELRDYERKIQEYQKQLMDIQRRKDAVKKAQNQEEERRSNFLTKQQSKEQTLERMQQEKANLLRAKSARSRLLEQTAKERVLKQQAEDEIERERKIQSLQDKMSKAERVEKQRELVRNALSNVRREMSRQEDAIKRQLSDLQLIDCHQFQVLTSSSLKSTLDGAPKRPKTSRGRIQRLDADQSLRVAGFERLGRPKTALGVGTELDGTSEMDETTSIVDQQDPGVVQSEIDLQAKHLKEEIDKEILRELDRREQMHTVSEPESLEDTFSKQRKRMIKRLTKLSQEVHRNAVSSC